MTIQTDEYTWELDDEKMVEAAGILGWEVAGFAQWLTIQAENNLLEEELDKHQTFLREATAEELAEWADHDYDRWVEAQER
jgi:hypothetical protein